MPQVNSGSQDIRHLQLSIRWKNQNRSAVNPDYSPDDTALYCFIDNIEKKSTAWNYDKTTGICTLTVPYKFFEGGRPKNGGQYILQIRFCSDNLWDNDDLGWHTQSSALFNSWYKQATNATPSPFGEWSNTQSLFCITRANTQINVDTDNYVPRVNWQYAPPENSPIDDPIAQVILQYDWDTKDVLGGTTR